MKKFKYVIIVMIVVIIIIISIILLLNLKNRENNKNENNEDISYDLQVDEDVYDVENVNIFFTVEDCINDYFNEIYEKNIKYVYNVLDSEYTKDKNITEENIKEKILTSNERYEFTASEIKVKEYSLDISIYLAKGKLKNIEKNSQEDYEIAVVLDFYNNKFSIIPECKIDNNNIKISEHFEDKQDNNLNILSLSKEDLAKRYYERFVSEEIYDIENAYSLLDEEYAKNRFGTIDKFKEYVQNNKEKIQNSTIVKFSVDSLKNGISKYKYVDNYNNYYTIEVKNMNIYSVKLDDYTIKEDDYNERYNKLSNEEKVKTNLSQIVSMINAQDYEKIFNCLNETFKKNNFDNINSFIEKIQSKTFEYNVLKINNIEKNNENIYVADITLASGSNLSAEYKEMVIIMKLNDDSSFEISFDIE